MTEPQQPQDFQPTPPAAPAYQDGPPAVPAYQPAPAAQPGKTLGIVALVLAFLAAPIGVILGIVALVQSKKAGAKNGLAIAAIIVGAVITVIEIIVIATMLAAMAALSGASGDAIIQAAEACAAGATEVEVMGQIIQCSDVM